MNPVVARIVAGAVALLLLCAALLLAKRSSSLPWGAGWSAAASLLFGGVGLVASWFVPEAFWDLLPLWVCLAALAVAHLLAARRAGLSAAAPSSPSPAEPDSASAGDGAPVSQPAEPSAPAGWAF